jgi:putative flippase GtrA
MRTSIEPGRGPKWNWRRWGVFNLVGLLGFALQLTMLFIFKSVLAMGYVKATAVAVECAVLHNFIWHEFFTWRDKAPFRSGVPGRLFRFHLANGMISIMGNLAITWVLVEQARCPYLLANAISVAICSVVNFVAGDRFVFPGEASDRKFRGEVYAKLI